MANTIKIKRSNVSSIPTTLEEGELAYSEVTDKLFIGTSSLDIDTIGGKSFTQDVDNIKAGTQSITGQPEVTQDKLIFRDYSALKNQYLTLGNGLSITGTTLDVTFPNSSNTLEEAATESGLVDPNADRILFWDDSVGKFAYLVPSTGLTISNTNLTVRTSSEIQTGIVELATTAEVNTGTDTTRAVTPAGFRYAGDIRYPQKTHSHVKSDITDLASYTTVREVHLSSEGQTLFTLGTFTYDIGTGGLSVYVNGVKQIVGAGNSYLETSTSSITFNTGLSLNDSVEFVGINSLQTYTPISITNYTKYEEFISSVKNTINISPNTYTPGSYQLLVFINGAKQAEGSSYTESSSSTITFSENLTIGDFVEIYITTYLTSSTSANVTTVLSTHNNLSGIQGGAIGDYQHVTTAQKTNWNNVYNWYSSMTSSDVDGLINTISEVLNAFSGSSESLNVITELTTPSNMTLDAGTF